MKFAYTVTVEAESLEQADQVIAERLDKDTDHGFPYVITYTEKN